MTARREAPRRAVALPLPDRDWAYFVDLDGTLVEIADVPGRIEINAALLGLLQETFRSTGGALALISGRSIANLDALIPAPRLPLAGQHGIERRNPHGEISRHPFPLRRLDQARRKLAQSVARRPGLMLEDKGSSLALHYRQAPAMAAFAHRLVREVGAELGRAFTIQPGKRVIEIKPAGRDKGDAILEFMREQPFRGRTPLFIGDDATDELGFVVINRLGGHSVKVGRGRTRAAWRLPDVAAVLGWLRSGTPSPRRTRRAARKTRS